MYIYVVVCCRQDNSLLWDPPPMESSFMGQSISLWLHYFGIPFYIWNPAETSEAGRVNTWNFKSVPNLIVVISLNPVNSGDSNGVIHVSIPALGDENRQLPRFCLPALPRKSPWRIGSYYTPLERYEWGDCSTVGIVRNGSLGVEKFRDRVWWIWI